MDIFTVVFILGLMGFFFTHCVYFFNLNWQSRKPVNFVNLLTLWFYSVYLGYYFLNSRTGLFLDRDQHLLLLGGGLLLIFTITDFFSDGKSLGLIFSILISILGITGVVHVHYQDTLSGLAGGPQDRILHFLLFLDQAAVLFFFLSILLAVLHYYSFIEVKYHHRFFFLNRFPGFDRLWHHMDAYLLAGCLFSAVSLFLSLRWDPSLAVSDLYGKVIGGITVLYYLFLLYIRYRKWFSFKLNLYWMLLSIIFLIVKVGYWL